MEKEYPGLRLYLTVYGSMLLIAILVMICVVAIDNKAVYSSTSKDLIKFGSQESWGKSDHVESFVDPVQGCEYIVIRSQGGNSKSITPRLKNGQPICNDLSTIIQKSN